MKHQNFEKEIPAGYKQALHINATDVKLGIIFNLIAFVVLAAVMVIAFLPLDINTLLETAKNGIGIVTMLVFIISMLLYIVLHELVHGIAYKALTGEKLTFGMSWSCAFCGVPHIYVYRKTALISVLAPFTVFTLIFIPLTVALYFVNPVYYLLSAVIFGMHLGGCSGDLYVTFLLLCKYKSPKTLMRDTGPEQFFFIPENEG